MLILVLLGVADAADAPPWTPTPPTDDGSTQPTCFPISDSVRALLEEGRLSGQRVFVEEHTACNGGSSGVLRANVEEGVLGHDALIQVLAPRSSDYEISPRAGGLLIAPKAGSHVLDYPVELAESRGTVLAARAALLGQVAIGRQLWIAPGDGAQDTNDPSHRRNDVRISRQPLLEAMIAIYEPHEPTDGWVLRIHDDAVDAYGRTQAHLLRLVVPPSE